MKEYLEKKIKTEDEVWDEAVKEESDAKMMMRLAGCTKHVKKFITEPDGVFIPTELFEEILRRLLK